ncbi:MAG: Na/Pi cotransporter family protein [Pseudobdellovibrionaceae bacterium]
MPSLVLLHIIGGVCLLLFGLRLVKTGVTRVFGVQLRKTIEAATRYRFTAFLAGLGVTALLQSSTATTMIISGFAGQGLISTASALAVVLGADVGTTLVAQVLTLDLSWLSPILVIVGYIFYAGKDLAAPRRQVGRILMGLGLMLLALFLIKSSAADFKDSEVLPLILAPLDRDPIFSVIMGVILTWLFHSSLAIVLLLMSMVGSGVIPLHLAFMMVLGANIGNVLAPLISGLKDTPEARRVPVGNLIMRLFGVVVVFALFEFLKPFLILIPADDARMVVNFHVLFNVFLAFLFMPFLGLVARMALEIVPDRADLAQKAVMPQYLDERVLDTPTVALTNAAREVLRIADMTDQMMQMIWVAFSKNDVAQISKIRAADEHVDRIYRALKTYLVKITQETMNEPEGKRHFQILTFATNIEHVGDIIDRNLLPMAERKIKEQLEFSDEGQLELDRLFNLVLDSVRLAQTVFISGDVRLARQLVDDKVIIKRAEKEASQNHLARLRRGIPETLATTDLHMDVIRDLRRINSLVTSIAYPILDDAGELRRSPFKDKEE